MAGRRVGEREIVGAFHYPNLLRLDFRFASSRRTSAFLATFSVGEERRNGDHDRGVVTAQAVRAFIQRPVDSRTSGSASRIFKVSLFAAYTLEDLSGTYIESSDVLNPSF